MTWKQFIHAIRTFLFYRHAAWTECPLRGLCKDYKEKQCIAICHIHRFFERFKWYWRNEMEDCFKPAEADK
jgi:hypothetical protein